MKKGFLILFLSCISNFIYAQSAADYFNRAANEYIYKNDQIALNTINTGLSNYPGNKDLETLKEKIEKEKKEQEQKQQEEQKKKEEEQQKQQEQQKQDEQKNKEQDQQNKDQEQEQNKEQEDQGEQSEDDQNAEKKEQEGQPEPQDSEEEGEKTDQPPQMSRGEKLEDMNLSEEKAKMILEAMKNSEIQYIQQNKRDATKKPDSNKPDW